MGTKLKVKIVLLGDQHVGKSCIIDKYINGKFDPNSSPTVGIDFLAKNAIHKGRGYRLQLWDTAGQERFRSLIPSYLKDAMSAIIVYDVTNKASLQNAAGWLKLFNEHKMNSGYSMLVGNKIDLPYRAVTTAQGRAVAGELGIGYAELSAKTGEKVEELFAHLLDMIVLGKTNGDVELTASIVEKAGQNSARKDEVKPPQEQTVPKTTPTMQVRMVSSLPKETDPIHPTNITSQPIVKEHDTIVKYPTPQHQVSPPYQPPPVQPLVHRNFETYVPSGSQASVPPQIPSHYNQPQHIIVPPPPPPGVMPTILLPPLTDNPITNVNQMQPNIVLNSRINEQQAGNTRRRCCRSS